MLRSRRTTPLAVLLAALGLAACNGVSEETYDEEVSRVCADVKRDVGELEGTGAETPDEIAALIDDVIAESREAVDRLAAVERPGGEAGERAERFVATLEREVEREAIPALTDLRDAIKSQDHEGAAEAGARLRRLESSKSDRRARELGADACAA